MTPLDIDQYVVFNVPSTMTVDPALITILINKWKVTLHEPMGVLVDWEEDTAYNYEQAILIGDLAVYDIIINYFNRGALGAGSAIAESGGSNSGSSGGGGSQTGGLKRVQAGPTEVEYFPVADSTNSNSNSSTIASASQATSSMIRPGGTLDEMKNRICMNADKLKINLLICKEIKIVKAPTVYRP